MWPMLEQCSRQVLWHGQRLAPENASLFTALWLKTKKLEQPEICLISTVALSYLACVPQMRKASMTELIEIVSGWLRAQRAVE